jgi:hypothetical protein
MLARRKKAEREQGELMRFVVFYAPYIPIQNFTAWADWGMGNGGLDKG